MSSVAVLHSHLQSVFARRGWGDCGLRPAVAPELASCGVPELDEALGGGFPRGALTEICGPASSGRTSLLYAFLAQITARQEVCALVDVSNAADPESLAAAGVDLRRLLWVRCGEKSKPAIQVHGAVSAPPPISGKKLGLSGGRSRHPREEVRGLDTAMSFLLEANGKLPGMSVRPRPVLPARGAPPEYTVIARCSGEQVALDREAPRRTEYFLEQKRGGVREQEPETRRASRAATSSSGKPWRRMEQALKVTDLLLNGGGFGAVVLDLGNIPWTDARRVPLTTWFRFRRAVENTPTVLVSLTEESCARTCASLVLTCERHQEEWRQAGRGTQATLQGFDVRVELLRSRRMQEIQSGARLPPGRAAEWKTQMQWSG